MPFDVGGSELFVGLQSRGLLRRVLDALPDAVTIGAVDGGPVYVNAAARRLLRLEGGHLPETFLEFRPAGFARYLRDVIIADAQHDGVWRGETTFLPRRGEPVRVSQTSVIHVDDGDVMYLLSIARPITDAGTAVAELRQAETRMRFALEAARAGVWEADLRSGSVLWSDTMRAVQGFTDEEFAGTLESFLALVHPDDRPGVTETIGGTADRPRDFSTEFRVFWPDGTTHWLESHGRVLAGDDGTPERVLAMARDVTERRLLQTQLEQAQRIEAVGQLAGGLAHDLNNLLTAVLGYGRLLEADLGDGDPRRRDAQEIVRAGERAAQLTRQLLVFGRAQILEPRALNVNDLIQGIARMLARVIGENIDLQLVLEQAIPTIKADQAQLEHVIVNLAVNARDAMEDGGRLILSTAARGLDDAAGAALMVPAGPYVVLSMRDTGTGMSADTRARMFEPFFTTKPRGKGTGLGLSTVFGIVKQSGGAIEVHSELGKGTTFNLYFPVVADAVAEASAAPSLPASTGTETLLLVEDDDAVRALTGKILRRSGYTVIAASRPSEALEVAPSHDRIDLLVTDVIMPGANGPDLFRALHDARPGLRVLYMSGFAPEAIARHGIVESGAPFIAKPFTAQDLVRKVRAALDGDEAERSS